MSLTSDLTSLEGNRCWHSKANIQRQQTSPDKWMVDLVETDIKILTMKNEDLDGLVRHFQTILLFRS